MAASHHALSHNEMLQLAQFYLVKTPSGENAVRVVRGAACDYGGEGAGMDRSHQAHPHVVYRKRFALAGTSKSMGANVRQRSCIDRQLGI
jgi:hypothetical protein